MTEKEETFLSHDDSAVLKHIDVYQGLITRIAGNSAACKQWCVVLVSAILAFSVKSNEAIHVILAFLPIAVFGFLDAYYLGLEQKFREQFNLSMDKMRNGKLTLKDLFVIKVDGKVPANFAQGWKSPATRPVYIGLASLVFVTFIALRFL